MKQSPTNELTQFILADLFSRGYFAWRNNTTGIPIPGGGFRPAAKTGVADVLAVRPPAGQFVSIEVKTGHDQMCPEQIGFKSSVEYVGGIALVVHTKEDYLLQVNKLSTVDTFVSQVL